jgi:hypothetical protein
MWRRVTGAAAAVASFQYWVEYLLARVLDNKQKKTKKQKNISLQVHR